jgi:small subunit ribosomal protein S21
VISEYSGSPHTQVWQPETARKNRRSFLFQAGLEVRVNMPVVVLRPNESSDSLMKRFRKKVVKSGVLSTLRRKRWFISKSEMRRVEKKKAIRRIKRRQYTKVGE